MCFNNNLLSIFKVILQFGTMDTNSSTSKDIISINLHMDITTWREVKECRMEVNITMMEAEEMIEVTVETETTEDTTEIIETIEETTAGTGIEIGAMTEIEVEDDYL